METFADSTLGRGNGSLVFPECRWERALTTVFSTVSETELVLLVLGYTGLFLYTAVIGHRTRRRLTRGPRSHRPDDRQFLENYGLFRRVAAVLALAVLLDVAEPAVRVTSRWWPMPQVAGLLHQARLFCAIFEGWAYGLLNKKLRAAYKTTLCRQSHRVAAQQAEVHRARTQRRRACTVSDAVPPPQPAPRAASAERAEVPPSPDQHRTFLGDSMTV